jgi:hypothetical protein
MNKQAIRSMLIKEVKTSNLSELAKGMIEEMLDSEHYDPDKEITAVKSPRGSTTIVLPQPLASRLAEQPKKTWKRGPRSKLAERQKHYEQIYQETLGLLETRSEKKPHFKITLSQLARRYKITKKSKYELRDYLMSKSRLDKYLVCKLGNRTTGYFVALPNYTPKEAVARVKKEKIAKTPREHRDYPFTRKQEKELNKARLDNKAFRKQFLHDATKKHIAEGHQYIQASIMASQEYSIWCKKRDAAKAITRQEQLDNHCEVEANEAKDSTAYEPVAWVEFPTIDGIKDTSIPYLKDLLKKLDSGMIPSITEAMDGYVLDVEPFKWAEFVADVMLRGDQIKDALGLSKNKSFVVKYSKLFFE